MSTLCDMRPPETPDDLLDRLVAEYSDALSRGGAAAGERVRLLASVPEALRASLELCFRAIESGLAGPPAALRPLGPGVVLGGHRIVREIGRGGMATVYEAEQAGLARRVALKVLRPGLALDRRHVERFHREALAIGKLAHPHVVPVHAAGEDGGHRFIVMELVPGPTLATLLASGPRPEREIASLLAPVARAVAAAHALGIVHRDLKPSNILFAADGRALVADFGLAKGEDDPGLSLTGEPIGTPYYMSPEQVERSAAAPVGARSDVYSLGVTLYEAFSGRRPFEGKTALAVFEAIRSAAPAPLAAASRDAAALVRRAMARRPEDRYASAADLASDLEALAAGRVTSARAREGGPVRRAATALARIARGERFEYRSSAALFSLPLLHVNFAGRGAGVRGLRRATGVVAIGNVATGVVALGRVAVGGLALGAIVGVGPLAVGGAAAMGGLAVGGGAGVGAHAVGGTAFGYAAIGGFAAGRYALGGSTLGPHAVNGAAVDEAARAYFAESFRWPVDLLLPQLSSILDR